MIPPIWKCDMPNCHIMFSSMDSKILHCCQEHNYKQFHDYIISLNGKSCELCPLQHHQFQSNDQKIHHLTSCHSKLLECYCPTCEMVAFHKKRRRCYGNLKHNPQWFQQQYLPFQHWYKYLLEHPPTNLEVESIQKMEELKKREIDIMFYNLQGNLCNWLKNWKCEEIKKNSMWV